MLKQLFGWGALVVGSLLAAGAFSCVLELPLLSRGACLSVGLFLGNWIS